MTRKIIFFLKICTEVVILETLYWVYIIYHSHENIIGFYYCIYFAYNCLLTLQANGTKLRLGQNMKMHVNHKPVKLPYIQLGVLTVSQEDQNVLVRTNLGKWRIFRFVSHSADPVRYAIVKTKLTCCF